MKPVFAYSLLLAACMMFLFTGCMYQEDKDIEFSLDTPLMDFLSAEKQADADSTQLLAMLRSYRFGILPLTPDTPVNSYLPAGMEVSVNAVEKTGGVVDITAGYPLEEGRTMQDVFSSSYGDAYLIPADHFSVARKVVDACHVVYSIRVKENETGKKLVYYVEISDTGTAADGKPYYNKALIVVEQATE